MKNLKEQIADLQKSGKFKTTNGQDFYAAPYLRPLNPCGYEQFKIGTVHGLWYSNKKAIIILAVINDSPGNGHFEDCLDWFLTACVQAELPLIFEEVDSLKDKVAGLQLSGRLAKHLVEKRGFKRIENTDNYIKDLKSIQQEVIKKLNDKTYIK